MSTSRRTFLSTSLASGAGFALASAGFAQPARAASAATRLHGAAGSSSAASLSVLILGGTGFLGPACTEALTARGHKVTLFNRGRSEDRRKRAGRPSAVPDGVEVLYGNRDPNKTADTDDSAEAGDKPVVAEGDSPKGLTQLEGKSWDAVIDTSGYWPRIVKASAEMLAKSTKQYVFISSISVYKDTSTPMTEATGVGELTEPEREEMGAQFERYGPAKAACEAAAEAAMPGRVTNIRPGFIVGQRDTSARFIYWPLRARRGGEMLIPGAPDDPIQIIDVRDLAEFIVTCLENKTMGVFNATGPDKELSMKSFVEQVKAGVGGPATTYTWVPSDFLEAHQAPGLPLYAPPTGESAGFHRVSVAKAMAAGLKFRPLPDTAKVTAEWHDGLTDELQKRVAASPMTPEKEAEILKAWHERASSSAPAAPADAGKK